MVKEISEYDYFEEIDKELIDTYENIKNIDTDSKIIIWYGENTDNQIGRRYLNALLKNKKSYEVST